jgi:hypothetical protein
MKYKNKYKFFHDTDSEVEKQTVKINKKNINDITYKSFVKINGIKYNDVIIKEDGNGVTIITPRRNEELRLDYDEVTAVFAALDSVMNEMGFINSEITFKDR